MIYLAALLIGVVAGLRAMMAPAITSWAAHLGWINVEGGWLAIMGWRFTPWVFSLIAAIELVTDQLPSTPSRKTPAQFGARILFGGLSGGTVGASAGLLWPGVVLGVVGAVIGAYGGAAARGALAKAFRSDRPAALIEDAVAIGGGLAIFCLLA